MSRNFVVRKTNNLSRVLYNLLKTFQKLSVSTKSSLDEISGNYGFLCSTDVRAIFLILHLCWHFLKLDNYNWQDLYIVANLLAVENLRSCDTIFLAYFPNVYQLKKTRVSLQKHDLFDVQFIANLWKIRNIAKKIESHIQSENCYRKHRITVISFSQSHTSVVSIF